MSKLDVDLMAAIQSSTEAVVDAAKPKLDPLVAKAVVLEEGASSFKDAFGWAPKLMKDIPVAIYKDEDWPEEIRARIPSPMPGYLWNRRHTENIVFALFRGGPILLHGPTGTGKTELPRQICAKLRIPFFRVGCHKQMEMSDFLGTNQVINDDGVSVTKHTHTDTTLAATHGGMLVVDEAFRSPILMAIQSLLEVPHSLVLQDAHGSNRVLHPAAPLSICLTDNTNGTGDTTGNYDAETQDVSTLDRIRHPVYVDYMERKAEVAMLTKNYTELDVGTINNIVAVANLVRAAFKENKIMQTMSLRALTNWADTVVYTGDIKVAFKMVFFEKLGGDDQAVVNACFRQVTGVDV